MSDEAIRVLEEAAASASQYVEKGRPASAACDALAGIEEALTALRAQPESGEAWRFIEDLAANKLQEEMSADEQWRASYEDAYGYIIMDARRIADLRTTLRQRPEEGESDGMAARTALARERDGGVSGVEGMGDLRSPVCGNDSGAGPALTPTEDAAEPVPPRVEMWPRDAWRVSFVDGCWLFNTLIPLGVRTYYRDGSDRWMQKFYPCSDPDCLNGQRELPLISTPCPHCNGTGIEPPAEDATIAEEFDAAVRNGGEVSAAAPAPLTEERVREIVQEVFTGWLEHAITSLASTEDKQ